MNTRPKIAIGLGVLLSLAAASVALHRPAAPTPTLESRGPLRFAWPAGEWWTYSFELVSHSKVNWVGPAPGASAMAIDPHQKGPALPQSQVGGDATVRGTFELSSEPTSGSAFRLVVRVTELSQLDVTVLDQNVFPSMSNALERLSSLAIAVDMEPNGKLQRLFLPHEGDPALVHLLQQLGSRLEMSLDGSTSPTWQSTELAPLGRAEVEYARNGADGLRRSRTRYVAWTSLPSNLAQERQDITSNGTISLDAGALGTLHDDELVRMVSRGTGEPMARIESHLAVDLIDHGMGARHPPLALASFDVQAPDQHLPRLDTERQLLTARATGFTRDALVQRVLVPPTTASAETHAWFNQATAYLKLNPAECQTLISSFVIAPDGGKFLLMDVLATVGSAEAQSAVRTMLSSSALPAKLHGKLLERMLKLETPEPEMVKYVLSLVKPGATVERDSVVYTLGALIRHASARGIDTQEALAPLVRGLHDARAPKDKIAFLDSLGNAAVPEEVHDVVGFAKDPDPGVRRSVADALRFTPTTQAQQTLVELTKDGNGLVQGQAFEVLASQATSEAMLFELAQVVKSGGVDPEAGPSLLTFLKEKRGEGPVVERMLEATANDSHLTPQVRASARQLSQRTPQSKK